MADRELSSRIIHKHDSAENWAKATNFIPKQGEIIVYDRDANYTYERIKIGDGITKVNSLPFLLDTDGITPVNKGGTGADNAEEALQNLGIYIGDTEPTDTNIRIWINTSEEGSGVIPLLPRIATVTLPASGWTGSTNPYSQVVVVNGVTVNSKLDLQPTAQQIVSLQNEDIALMAENNAGTVTFYALGGKPTTNYTMQVLLTEVAFV
jgi:hypothetical protein